MRENVAKGSDKTRGDTLIPDTSFATPTHAQSITTPRSCGCVSDTVLSVAVSRPGAPPCRWLRRPRRRRLPRAVVLSSGGCLVRVGNRVGNRVGARRDWLRRGRAQWRQAQREVIDSQRAAEEVALPEVDAGVAGLGCLTQVLDALGHRCEPERLRQADDGVHDRTPGGLAEVAMKSRSILR